MCLALLLLSVFVLLLFPVSLLVAGKRGPRHGRPSHSQKGPGFRRPRISWLRGFGGFWGFGDMVGASWKASSLKLWASGVLLVSVLFEVAKKNRCKERVSEDPEVSRIADSPPKAMLCRLWSFSSLGGAILKASFGSHGNPYDTSKNPTLEAV